MTRKNPQTTAAASPRGAVQPCEPRPPVVAQGDRSPSPSLLEAAAKGSPDVPAATEASAPVAAEASRCPAVPGEGGRGTGTKPLSGKAFRDALKAAQSAKAKGQRQQRAGSWASRDPYARAVPGGRKPPPKDVA
jgi:hypothetical protein